MGHTHLGDNTLTLRHLTGPKGRSNLALGNAQGCRLRLAER
jgi:hypothetical protein